MRAFVIALGALPVIGCQLVTGSFDVGDAGASSGSDTGSNDAVTSSPDATSNDANGPGSDGGESATFTMSQTCLSQHNPTATLDITLNGSNVTVVRSSSTDGNNPTYTGTMSADCTSVSGTYAGGASWTATVIGSTPSAAGCSLGTIWAEREADCVAGWSRDGQPGPSGTNATFLTTEDCLPVSAPSEVTATLAVTLTSGTELSITTTQSSNGNDPTFTGTMTRKCTQASGYHGVGDPDTWSKWNASVVVGSGTTAGGGCSLGRVWEESANGCVAVWTWIGQ